jgi:hypothetical protein
MVLEGLMRVETSFVNFDRNLCKYRTMIGYRAAYFLGPLVFFLTGFSACNSGENKPEERLIPNVSDEKESIKQLNIARFEQDLFRCSDRTFVNDTLDIRKKYNSFFDLFTSRIIRVGNIQQPLFKQNLLGFLNDPDIKSVYSECQKQYPNLEAEEMALSEAFGRYHRIFPDSLIPQLVSMISGFNYTIATSDSVLAIGLDMYLGTKCRFYELLAMPQFKTQNMNRRNIVTDAIRGYLMAAFPMNAKTDDLISWMVYHGKIAFLSQLLLPELNEALILGYTDKQAAYNKENESLIWSHFVDKQLFYSKDFNDQVNYINDGPFTPGFTQETPPRMGVWLGLQLVKKYMDQNRQVTIPELMKNNDMHAIFKQSGYKPPKL